MSVPADNERFRGATAWALRQHKSPTMLVTLELKGGTTHMFEVHEGRELGLLAQFVERHEILLEQSP